MTTGLLVGIATLLASALGTFLLYREVRIGHEVEKLGEELGEIADLRLLYRIDRHEFIIGYLAYGLKFNRAQANDAMDLVGERNVDALAAEYHDALEAQSRDALDRWQRKTLPSIRAQRLLLLRAGFVLLLLAAILTFTADAGLLD
jgi:hypothetical protein